MSDPAKWGVRLEAAVCEHCDWSYLLPPNSPPQRCPHCFNATLTAVEQPFEQLPIYPPEMVIKPQLSRGKIAAQIEQFAKGIPFTPKDLSPDTLSGRIRHTYIPLWLVDSNVHADWRAEMGYDYQVVSHQEIYDQNKGGWHTKEVKETRIRWEPRIGRLNRTYNNHLAPALEDEAEMGQRLGEYQLKSAEPYQPALIAQAFIRLPNRAPEDAWPDAEPAFLQAGTADCQKAAEADHIRDYRWSAEFHNRNWTQLLRSVYATYYLDDDGQPHPVYLNGQTGFISGSRRASMKLARRWTLIILAIALILFGVGGILAAVGYLFEVPGGTTIGSIGLFFSLIIAALALLPIFVAWNFNRKHRSKSQ
ncbi:MAG: hypothetical protein WAM60_02465 [Candidatus Promineifilaceae bacterium]